jgi:hypothetical protein
MISKKSLPSSLEASQMPMYKGLMAREGESFTLPSPSLVWRIRTQRAQSCCDLLQSCSHLGWVRIREWKREGEVRVNESHSRVTYPLISKINPREYPLIKFKGHSFFFFVDKIH